MVSSATTRNRFEKIGPGEQLNSWGGPNGLNRVIDLTDASLDGWVTISASGSTTLTSANYIADQARLRIIKYTGSTSGTITIPSVEKWYIVKAVSADVTITTGGATNATVKAGDTAIVLCDAANCYKMQSNDFGGSEIVNIAETPLTNGSAASKAYVDAQAFAGTGQLPGINAGTTYQVVSNNGTGALWKRGLPVSSASTTGQVLKSTGADGYPADTSQWAWDGFQGVSAKSTSYTLALTDRAKLITCTSTFTLSLTAAATLGNQFYAHIANNGTGLINIDPNGSETITFPGQSARTTIVLVPGEAIILQCDGSNWTGTVSQQAGLCLYAYESSAPSYSSTTWTARVVSNLSINKLGVTYSSGSLQGVPPGRYMAITTARAIGVNFFSSRIYDNTAASVIDYGDTGYAANFGGSVYISDSSRAYTEFVLTQSSDLRIESYATISETGAAWGTTSPSGGAPTISADVHLVRVSP